MKAVMYLPGQLHPDGSDMAKWTARCLEHIERRGHQLVAVVNGVSGDDRWTAVEQMLRSGEVEVVVVARQDHLVHLHFEAVDQWAAGPAQPQSQRRPQVVNRGTGQPFAVDTGGPDRRTVRTGRTRPQLDGGVGHQQPEDHPWRRWPDSREPDRRPRRIER